MEKFCVAGMGQVSTRWGNGLDRTYGPPNVRPYTWPTGQSAECTPSRNVRQAETYAETMYGLFHQARTMCAGTRECAPRRDKTRESAKDTEVMGSVICAVWGGAAGGRVCMWHICVGVGYVCRICVWIRRVGCEHSFMEPFLGPLRGTAMCVVKALAASYERRNLPLSVMRKPNACSRERACAPAESNARRRTCWSPPLPGLCP